MFFKLLSRIQFLVQSTNQHGVHSPFVFDFVTKGLYQKISKETSLKAISSIRNLSNKEEKILQKIASYFQIETIYTSVNQLEKRFDKSYKILLINNLYHFNFEKINVDLSEIIIIFQGIHSNRKAYQKWLCFCEHSKSIVTIDLYYFGLIFFRNEQAKEHFKIRV